MQTMASISPAPTQRTSAIEKTPLLISENQPQVYLAEFMQQDMDRAPESITNVGRTSGKDCTIPHQIHHLEFRLIT